MTDKIKMVEDSDLDEDNKKLLKLSEIPWREYLAEKGYVDDGIENMCSSCIKKQVEDHGKQVIPCKGLLTAETQLGDDLYKAIIEKSTPEEVEVLHSMYDPYAFMDNNVDLERKGKPNRKFSSRWYQERVVKCLSEDTDILMGDGSYKKIKDVEVDDKVVSYNETRRSAPVNKVLNKWYSGEKEVFLITLENGDKLEATEDHPILAWVQKGVLNPLLQCPSFKTDYVSIKDGLKVGMDVYTLNASPVFGKESDLRLAKMLGYLITDGYINLKNTKVEFTNTNWDYVNEFKVCAEALGNKVSLYTKPAKGDRKEAYTVKVLSNKGTSPFYKFLRSINALDKNSKEKSIFDFVLNQGSLEFVVNFLNRAYAGDGCIYVNPDKNSGKLSIHSCYDSYMIKNWYKLLRKVGVQSINTYKYQREAGSSSSVISQADSIKTFFNLVGPIFGKEKKSLELAQKLSSIQSCSRRGTFRTSSRTKIISIESVGVKPTYDIEVDKRHNFIANNIIVHNCSAKSKVVRMGRRTGKTYAMAVLILHKVLTNKNYRVLLVSPYAAQTEEVVENIKALCSMLPENPIVSSKGSPIHVVTFNTGSVLKGFTASTDANSVRGQPGHLLVLDEVDDIPEKAMISIMGIKMDNKDVEVWRSGTPKGELNLHHAEKDPTTKAFHYPSFVIPHYDDQLDAELREDLGEIGFVQETMAEFGLVSNGVFQTLFIQRAQQRAVFVKAEDVLADRRRFIVTIGVDWNHDQVGTRIVVIAYDKMNPQFSIIEKEAVAIVGYTQQAAMEKIIHLNRKYNADHIFCDEGFGVTQIGDLKRVGEAAAGKVPQGHPDLKLLDIQAVNFSSNTEIRDPVSGEMYKTPTKQFAVSNTVLMLERDMISLHPKEDNDIILQMKNYIEKSRNKGKIVYSYLSKKIGDHDLDALMIGLYGYRKIYSSLFEGSVFQAMIKFADKNDPEQQNTGGILPVQDDLLISSGIVPLRFSSRSGINNSARVVSLGGASRRRNHFK